MVCSKLLNLRRAKLNLKPVKLAKAGALTSKVVSNRIDFEKTVSAVPELELATTQKEMGRRVELLGMSTGVGGISPNSGAAPLATGLGRQIQAYPLLGEVVVELRSYSG